MRGRGCRRSGRARVGPATATTALAACAALVLAGCGAAVHTDVGSVPPTTATSARPGPALARGDWPTYHRDNARSGDAVDVPPPSALTPAWHTRLDGAVYGQPLVVNGQVLAATENDTVYALDAATGTVRWSAHVGTPMRLADLPCGNIDPLGITGTPVYDPATSRVFAVAETTGGVHQLVGVNVTTGAVEVRVPMEPPRGDRRAHQQRAALTLLGDRVYVAFGGLFGDCGDYTGAVVSVTTAGTDQRGYAASSSGQGGIWAPGGAVVDAGGRLLYAVGNGDSTSNYDNSDSVVALTPNLDRVDLFAPSTWAADNAADADLGSASPTLLGPWVFIAGKRGVGYVLARDSFGGIGGQRGQADVCRSYGGSAVAGTTAYLPCTDGPRALTIAGDGTPRVLWHAPVAATGSPVVGGGAVWVVDVKAGVLYALDQATGVVRQRLDVGKVPTFASPTLSGTRAYLGTTDGVLAVGGV